MNKSERKRKKQPARGCVGCCDPLTDDDALLVDGLGLVCGRCAPVVDEVFEIELDEIDVALAAARACLRMVNDMTLLPRSEWSAFVRQRKVDRGEA